MILQKQELVKPKIFGFAVVQVRRTYKRYKAYVVSFLTHFLMFFDF